MFDTSSFDDYYEVSNFSHYFNSRKIIETLKRECDRKILLFIYNKDIYQLYDDLSDLFCFIEFNLRDYLSQELKYNLALRINEKQIIDFAFLDKIHEMKSEIKNKKINNDDSFLTYLFFKLFSIEIEKLSEPTEQVRVLFKAVLRLKGLEEEIFDSYLKLLKDFLISSVLSQANKDNLQLLDQFNKNCNTKNQVTAFVNKLCWLFFINNYTQEDQKELLSYKLNERDFLLLSKVSVNSLQKTVKQIEIEIVNYLKDNSNTLDLIYNAYESIRKNLIFRNLITASLKATDINRKEQLIHKLFDSVNTLLFVEDYKKFVIILSSYMILSYVKDIYNNNKVSEFINTFIRKTKILLIIHDKDIYKKIQKDISQIHNLQKFINSIIEMPKSPEIILDWLDYYKDIIIPFVNLFEEIFEANINPLYLTNIDDKGNLISLITNKFNRIITDKNNQFEEIVFNEYPDFIDRNYDFLNASTPKILANQITDNKKAIYLVFDGVPLSSWVHLRKKFEERKFTFQVDEQILCMLPSITLISRRSLFAGMLPSTLYSESIRNPNFRKNDEKLMLNNYLEKTLNRKISIAYISDLSVEILRKYLVMDYKDLPDVIVFLIKTADKIQHGIQKGDITSIRISIVNAITNFIENILKIAEKHKLDIISTCDHGIVECTKVSKFPNLRLSKPKNYQSVGSGRHVFVTTQKNTPINEKNDILNYIRSVSSSANEFFISHEELHRYGIPEFWDNGEEILCCVLARGMKKFSWSKDSLNHGGLSFDELIVHKAVAVFTEKLDYKDLTFIPDEKPLYSSEKNVIPIRILNQNKISAYNVNITNQLQDSIYEIDEIKPGEEETIQLYVYVEEGLKEYQIKLRINYEIFDDEKMINYQYTIKEIKKGKKESVTVDRSADAAIDDLMKNI